jgi:hypothetical protein
MKYDALQQAAVQASAELHQIVAEIERLEAQRLGLLARRESLQVIGQHLLAVMSMIEEAQPVAATAADADPVSTPELAASDPPAVVNALPEPEPEPLPQEEVLACAPADSVADAPAGKWPSLLELLDRNKRSSLRGEGWRGNPPVTHLELRALARAAD